MFAKPSFDETVLVCPGAAIVGNVTLGKNVSVWYNAVLRGDEGTITVGENTNIQDCAVLHEETHVGAGCTIGHGAIAVSYTHLGPVGAGGAAAGRGNAEYRRAPSGGGQPKRL